MPIIVTALLFAAQADAAASPTPVAAKPEKKQCRRMDSATGSIMPGRSVCHTRAEWTRIDEINNNAARSMHDRALNGGGLGSSSR